ncbi:DUF4838 domain-containing protein [Pedobacter sp.]
MQKRTSFLIILAHFFITSCAGSNGFVLYKKGEVKPVVHYKNNTKPAAGDMVALFSKLGISLTVTEQLPKTNSPYIQLEINPEISGFSLTQKENYLSVVASSAKDLKQAIRYFFSNYTTLNEFTKNKTKLLQEIIVVPMELSYQSDAVLAYKEPYFTQNFDSEFRLWNNTNTLEETWGLWGHNIGKFIKVTPKMYAIVNGEPNEEQLNFSSPELQNALEVAIAEKLSDNPAANKFMVMPYDNELTCTCEKCIKTGNTKTNASPAVYALINKLAAKFPMASFFSTAYITTENPPNKPVNANVGVMISTMSFPKGIVLAHSNHAASIAETFKKWQKTTQNIYLWDYAINFDNYFEAYPTVSITQKNLQFYVKNGVTGIFIHGSDEGSFAAFGDLKAYLYAKLLNNIQADLKQHTRLFLETKYPAFGKELADYYIEIEQTALNNKRTLDIYGGIKNAVHKYLKQDDLAKLIDVILAKQQHIKPTDKKAANTLLLSLVFQHLELLRVNGIAENGYATFERGKLTLNPILEKYLSLLKQLSSATEIEKYNEIGITISTYISAWHSRIIIAPYQNLAYHKHFKAKSKLDEDYATTDILSDGTIGFQDYYNNWLINSTALLSLETTTAGLQKATTLQIDFLYDKKHKIYPPEKVSVYIGQNNYEIILGEKEEVGDTRKIVRASTPIKIGANDDTLRIEIKKQAENRKRSMACDEITIK